MSILKNEYCEFVSNIDGSDADLVVGSQVKRNSQTWRQSTGIGIVIRLCTGGTVDVLWDHDDGFDSDVAYFTKKLAAAMKIPKEFLYGSYDIDRDKS